MPWRKAKCLRLEMRKTFRLSWLLVKWRKGKKIVWNLIKDVSCGTVSISRFNSVIFTLIACTESEWVVEEQRKRMVISSFNAEMSPKGKYLVFVAPPHVHILTFSYLQVLQFANFLTLNRQLARLFRVGVSINKNYRGFPVWLRLLSRVPRIFIYFQSSWSLSETVHNNRWM